MCLNSSGDHTYTCRNSRQKQLRKIPVFTRASLLNLKARHSQVQVLYPSLNQSPSPSLCSIYYSSRVLTISKYSTKKAKKGPIIKLEMGWLGKPNI